MATKITVGCRYPAGITMRLDQMVDVDRPVMAGGVKTVKEARPWPEKGSVKLNGCARFVGKDAPHDIRSGAGLTYGVDSDFFAEWARQNPELIKNKVVFAQVKADEAGAEAKDIKAAKTGLEPLDPKNMPDEFRGKIETAPEQRT